MWSAMLAKRCVLVAILSFAVSTSAPGSAVAQDAPAAQWHLDGEAGGSTPDSSGNGLQGQVTGGATFVAGGRFDNALDLPSPPGSRINVADSTVLEPEHVTVLTWVNNLGSPGSFKWVFAKGAQQCSGASYGLTTGVNGGLAFSMFDGSAHGSPDAGPGLWDGHWHAVAGTYDGATERLYVDGAEVGTGTAVATTPSYGLQFDNTNIGNYPGSTFCNFDYTFPGLIDETRVYGRALTAAEIAHLQRSGHTSPPSLPPPAEPGPGPGPGPAPGPSPTPQPPPGPVEGNVTAPKITGSGNNYSCDEGTWSGLAADPAFGYTWLRYDRGPTGLLRFTTVSSSKTYTLPANAVGAKHYCEVSARAGSGRRLSAVSPTVVLTGKREIPPIQVFKRPFGNFRVRGIDVFQTTQPNSAAQTFGFPTARSFPSYCGGGTPTSYRSDPVTGCVAGSDPARVPYAGVPVDARQLAWALVYVDMDGARAEDPTQRLDVTLRGFVGASRLPGSVTRSVTNPAVSTTPYVTQPERVTQGKYLVFPLPGDWLATAAAGGQRLSLEATATLPVGAGSGVLFECPAILVAGGPSCADDNHFRVDAIGVFDDLQNLTIRSLPLIRPGQTVATLNPPSAVLQRVRDLFPGGQGLNILPYQGSAAIDPLALTASSTACKGFLDSSVPPAVDVRSCRMANINMAVTQWFGASAANREGYGLLMGVHRYDEGDGFEEPGWMTPSGVTIATRGAVPRIMVNDGNAKRPLTAAAHEFLHALGAPHADTIGPEPITGDTCGGWKDGQTAEPWPPDNTGRLQGVMFRATVRLGGSAFSLSADDGAPPLFDLMSYCLNGDPNAWLSPRNWNRAFDAMRAYLKPAPRRAVRGGTRQAEAGQALAIGTLGPSGGQVARVVPPDSDNLVPASDPSSPVTIRSLDGAGGVMAESGAQVDRLTNSADAASFAAPVAPGAAAVEMVSGGAVIDRKQRSRPPTVRVLAPLRRTHVGANLLVRWSAADPDGEELQALVEYAADGRSNWSTVYQGPSQGRLTIPGRFLTRSRRGRVRVTLNDGFNEASSQTGPLQVDGAPPTAQIVRPVDGEDLQAGRVRLVGSAMDGGQRSLRGRSLTWFAGPRRLGSGERLKVTLPAGRVTLRLRVRDSLGREDTSVRRLQVAPPMLALSALRAPDRVGARARTVIVRVATTTPATLRAGGRSYLVDSRTRSLAIRLPARPRAGLMKVVLTVKARGVRQPVVRETLLILRV